jgi:hypothetical protein
MAAALKEPSEEPADFWASMEAAVDAVVAAPAAEEAMAEECLDYVRVRDTITPRGSPAWRTRRERGAGIRRHAPHLRPWEDIV